MSWHRQAFIAAVSLALLLAFCGKAQAVPVGCYPPKALELNTLEEVAADTTKLPASATECEATCYNAQSPKPLAVYTLGTCYCTSAIPDIFTKIPDVNCVEVAPAASNGASKNATAPPGYTLLYAHQVKNEDCTVAPVPFFSNWWQNSLGKRINFTDGLNELDKTTGRLHMRLTKNQGSLKLFTVDSWRYGYFTTKMIPYGPGIGAVTTFYTTSSYSDEDMAPENRVPWDEITLSFPSSYPRQFPDTMTKAERVRAAIGSLWTKNYQEGTGYNETLTTVPDLRTLTGDKQFNAFSGLQTYGINWQPNNLDWFVKGVNVDRISKDHPLPSQPSRLAVGVWRPQGYDCWEFGGCNNSEPYEAYFADVRRIVCGDPKLISSYEVLNYNPSPPPPPIPPPFPPPKPPSPPPPPGAVAPAPVEGVTLPPGTNNSLGVVDQNTLLPSTGLLGTTTAASAATTSHPGSWLLGVLAMILALAVQFGGQQ